MTMSSKLKVTVVGGILLLAGTLGGFGQETRATLGGKVTDTAGAVIQKATIVVTADRTTPVSSAVTTIVAFWITAPAVSVTLPPNVALVSCPNPPNVPASSNMPPTTVTFNLLLIVILAPLLYNIQ